VATLLRLYDYRRKARPVFFTRIELNQLLSIYSRRVMRGEWRDYAIDQQENTVRFSIFRHTHERPLYAVVKFTPGTGRNGDYAVLSGPQRLATGGSLGEVLQALQRHLPAVEPVDIEKYR